MPRFPARGVQASATTSPMMTADASTRTAASDLISNPEVAAAIDAAVTALSDAQAAITSARPPADELGTSYDALLGRLAESRGKGALYPYVGSGLGNGPLVELSDGSVKWDMIGGIGVHMFGHSDPDLIGTAMRAAMSDTIMQGNLQCNVEAIEFAELLLTEAGRTSDLMHCFITNSGAIANESALKVCFQRNAPAERILLLGLLRRAYDGDGAAHRQPVGARQPSAQHARRLRAVLRSGRPRGLDGVHAAAPRRVHQTLSPRSRVLRHGARAGRRRLQRGAAVVHRAADASLPRRRHRGLGRRGPDVSGARTRCSTSSSSASASWSTS